MEKDQGPVKQKEDKTIRQIIKKRPYDEYIGTITYTYSIVSKVSKSSLFSNERLLILAGNQVIGYSRQLPNKTELPFKQINRIPTVKASINLGNLLNITSNKQILTLKYVQNKEDLKWQFKCSSKECADQWRRRIQVAVELKKNQSPLKKDPLQSKEQNNKVPENSSHQGISNEEAKINAQISSVQQIKNTQIKNTQIKNTQIKNQVEIPLIEEKNEQRKPSVSVSLFIGGRSMSREEEEQIIKQDESNPSSFEKEPTSIFLKGKSVVSEQVEYESSYNQLTPTAKSQIKAQYEAKIKQEEQLRQKMKVNPNEKGGNFIESLIAVSKGSLDEGFILQKLYQNWAYEFAKGGNQYQLIDRFRAYGSVIVRRIINEFGIQQKKRSYKPTEIGKNYQRYQISGVNFDIFNSEERELSKSQKQKNTINSLETIVTQSYAKMARNQFKNYDYILKITKNKGKIRVPLSAIFQYKGFIVFAKVIVPYTNKNNSAEFLEKQLDKLQKTSHISNSVFQDPNCIRIMSLNSSVFDKISNTEKLSRKYDLYYIEDAKNYLVCDMNKLNKQKNYEKIRFQLIEGQDQQKNLYSGENMGQLINKQRINEQKQQQIDQLTNLSQQIYNQIDRMVAQLEDLNETFTNSIQLSQILHEYGINIRYLGVVESKITRPWLKYIIHSEIAGRCVKHFLRLELQNQILKINQTTIEAAEKLQIKQTIQFLNQIVGTGNKTSNIWNRLNRQAEYYFSTSLNREELNHGYFLQAIIYHCKIKFKNLPESIRLFKSNNYFNEEQFQEFSTHFTGYNLSFTDLYKMTSDYLSGSDIQSYQKLSVLLNLSRSSIPSHFKLSNYYDKIIQYLSNWLSPEEGKDIYYPQQFDNYQQIPSKSLYQIKLTEVKWAFKQKNQKKGQFIGQWVISHINKWLGTNHSVLTQLYDIYSSYYILKNDQEKSVEFCKIAIKNIQSLSQNEQKLSQAYYHLGQTYMHYGKNVEALKILQKAKSFFKTNNKESQAYGLICLMIGKLYLSLNKFEDAQNYGFQALQQLLNGYQKPKIIECLEIISECYEMGQKWDDYLKFIQQYVNGKIQQMVSDRQLLIRILKIIIVPYLKRVNIQSPTSSKTIILIIEELNKSTNVNLSKSNIYSVRSTQSNVNSIPNNSYDMAFNYIKARVIDETIPSYFTNQLIKIQQVLYQIQQNNMVSRWKGLEALSNQTMLNKIEGSIKTKGFDFLANLQALSILFGENYFQKKLTIK